MSFTVKVELKDEKFDAYKEKYGKSERSMAGCMRSLYYLKSGWQKKVGVHTDPLTLNGNGLSLGQKILRKQPKMLLRAFLKVLLFHLNQRQKTISEKYNCFTETSVLD